MTWFNNNRDAQVKGLERVPNIKCLDQNKTQWVVPITTNKGLRSIFITLPAQFPSAPPILYIDPNFQHPYADDNGNIKKLPEIQRWTQKSDLGQLLVLVVRNFIANPPMPKNVYHQCCGAGGTGVPQPSNNPVTYSRPPPMYVPNPQVVTQRVSTALPVTDNTLDLEHIKFSIPQNIWELPLLKDVSEEKMKELLKDETAMHDFAFELGIGPREVKISSQDALLQTAQKILTRKQKLIK